MMIVNNCIIYQYQLPCTALDDNKTILIIYIHIVGNAPTSRCVKSAWKQQLNSCSADYCRGWTKTHFLSVVLHKSRHFTMWWWHQRQIPLSESGAFQFSLTLRGVFTRLCRPVTFWILIWVCMLWCPHSRKSVHTHTRGIHRCPWEITAGGRGCLELRALTLPPPAPIPPSHRVPGGQTDHYFLLHPVLCWRKGHLPASPAAEQHWTTLTHWPLSRRSWNEDRDLFALISNWTQV